MRRTRWLLPSPMRTWAGRQSRSPLVGPLRSRRSRRCSRRLRHCIGHPPRLDHFCSIIQRTRFIDGNTAGRGTGGAVTSSKGKRGQQGKDRFHARIIAQPGQRKRAGGQCHPAPSCQPLRAGDYIILGPAFFSASLVAASAAAPAASLAGAEAPADGAAAASLAGASATGEALASAVATASSAGISTFSAAASSLALSELPQAESASAATEAKTAVAIFFMGNPLARLKADGPWEVSARHLL